MKSSSSGSPQPHPLKHIKTSLSSGAIQKQLYGFGGHGLPVPAINHKDMLEKLYPVVLL